MGWLASRLLGPEIGICGQDVVWFAGDRHPQKSGATMADMDALLGKLELACRAFKEKEATANWEWEDRMDAALSVYPAENGPKVRDVLEEHFAATWSAATLADAPAALQRLVGSLGGIRGGQELLTSDPSLDLMVAVALWPWGSGAKISIRLWLLSQGASADGDEDLRDRFRSWF